MAVGTSCFWCSKATLRVKGSQCLGTLSPAGVQPAVKDAQSVPGESVDESHTLSGSGTFCLGKS
jgi:hypothetical protein